MYTRSLQVFSLALFLISRLLPANARESRPGTPGEQEQPYTYSVNVGLVVLPVSVTDRHGDVISGLKAKNFEVFEDGVPQTIQLFDSSDIPVAMGLVIDNSASMAAKHSEVVLSALALVRDSNPEDQIFVIHFNEHVVFALNSSTPFTGNLKDLWDAVTEARAQGKTALYDAIIAGIKHLNESPLKKKVLVVISDGGDNASSHNLQETVQAAESSEAVIYTVGLFGPYDMDKDPKILKELARKTGGEYFFPRRLSELPDICKIIARDVRTQYTLGYISTNPRRDGSYRTIRVEVTVPNRHALNVRTRAGYFAPKPESHAGTAHRELP
jgi:Ca-activated chloride channel family protein